MRTIKAIQLYKKIESINKTLKDLNCYIKHIQVDCHGIKGTCNNYDSFKELINKVLNVGTKYNDLSKKEIDILSDIDNLKLTIANDNQFLNKDIMLKINIEQTT